MYNRTLHDHLYVNNLEAIIMEITDNGTTSYVVEIFQWHKNRALGRTVYATKSFGLVHRAEAWAKNLMDRPEFMVLRYNGRVLYDAE